jgi:hypothetical protein
MESGNGITSVQDSSLVPIFRTFKFSQEAQEKNRFRRCITGDGSWFTLEFQHSAKWSMSRDEVSQRVKQTIGTGEFMLTVLWGLDGFHVVNLMPERHSFNTQYFLEHIMRELVCSVFPDGRKPHSRRCNAHLDNCRVHCSKASEVFFMEFSAVCNFWSSLHCGFLVSTLTDTIRP